MGGVPDAKQKMSVWMWATRSAVKVTVMAFLAFGLLGPTIWIEDASAGMREVCKSVSTRVRDPLKSGGWDDDVVCWTIYTDDERDSGERDDLRDSNRGTRDLGKDPNFKDMKCKGNPIVIATGNKIETENDFTTSGEMPLNLGRTYNHYWTGVGIFGRQWVSSFDYKLTFGSVVVNACYPRPGGGACGIGANTVIYAWRPDGRTIKFIKKANGIFEEDKPTPLARIEVQANGKFHLTTEDAGYEIYSSAGYVEWVRNQTNVSWTFTYTNGTYPYRVTHRSGRYVEFNWTSGQLTAVRDPAGNYYGFAYTPNVFGAGLHRLASTSKPGLPAQTTTYHYEGVDLTALTGKSFNGVRYSTFTYNSNRYATSTQHNGLEKFSFSYTSGAGGLLTVVETNPLGKQTTHVFKDGRPTTTTGHASTYCPASLALVEYDVNGYKQMESDFNNNKTAYVYNGAGQLLQKTEAFGTPVARTTTYEWGGYGNRLLSETVAGLRRTTYSYNPVGRIETVSTTNLAANGVANQVRTTQFSYTDYGTNSGGVLSPGMIATIAINGPIAGSADTTITSYDSLGNLTSERNTLGHETVYGSHNGLGQPGRITNANGGIMDYGYDARGRVTTVRSYSNGNGGVPVDTTYAYNGNGTLASMTQPDGVVTRFTYDSGLRMLQALRDAVGVLIGAGSKEQINYTYDLASNGLSVTTAEGTAAPSPPPPDPGNPGGPGGGGGGGGTCTGTICQQPLLVPGTPTTLYATGAATAASLPVGSTYGKYTDYDELSRVRAQRGNSGQNVRYTYDLNGNIRTITDSSNRVTTLGYDELNRLVYSIAPEGNGTTWFEYSVGDQVTKVTDPRGKATSYVYDGFGQLWAQYSPDTGTTTFQYDASGLVTYMTRSDGSALAYQYDGLGRLTWYGTSTEGRAYGYDWCGNGKGLLCNADYIGGTRHYGYSLYGQLTITRDWTPTSDEWTGYSYDTFGRLAGISYPSGVSVGYGFSQGRLTVMQATINGVTQNVATGLKYQPFGPMSQLTYGNGVIKERAYDSDGRITSTHDHGWVGHTQHYTVDNQISAIDNWSRPTYNQTFSYDALSRIIGINSPSGNQTLYYDANGNRTRQVWAADMPYNVDVNSNRLNSEHISYSYDSRGNRLSQSWGGSTASYTYDAFNRMRSVTRNVASTYNSPDDWLSKVRPAGTTTYTVNALDQRVAKSGAPGNSRFVYTGQNQMITEYTNGVWSSYLWLGTELVALVRNNELFFVHGDHLGRPEVVTDTSNNWRWIAANYAFGRAVLGENNSIGGLNIGLPGQYYDAETGFWNNGMRDYDGRTGTYLQSDPIGLSGGLNTYAYVNGNPVNAIDPIGLESPQYSLGQIPGQAYRTPCENDALMGLMMNMTPLTSALKLTKDALGAEVEFDGGIPSLSFFQYEPSSTGTAVGGYVADGVASGMYDGHIDNMARRARNTSISYQLRNAATNRMNSSLQRKAVVKGGGKLLGPAGAIYEFSEALEKCGCEKK